MSMRACRMGISMAVILAIMVTAAVRLDQPAWVAVGLLGPAWSAGGLLSRRHGRSAR